METEVKIDKQQIAKQKRAWFSVKTIPWFMGFSNDLIFYIAINTLFLTTVKNFNASQISLFTTIPCLCYIVLQRYFLKIIKKIQNKKAVCLGCILLFIASVIITFAKSFTVVMIGQILFTIAFIFKSMDNIMLKNNLIFLDKKDDYIKYKNKASIIYSIVTAIIALCSGYLFKANQYLPMYLCILSCLINLIISFMLTEEIPNKDYCDEEDKKQVKVKFNYTIILIMISYGLFYAVISRGQANSKLMIQYQLSDYFDIGNTAIYFSYILVLSRISRILSNITFYKIYSKVKEKIGYYLPILCGIAFSLIIIGFYLEQILIKFIIMTIGFCIILGIRDVFGTYMQDLLLKKSKVSEQQTFLSYLGLSRKIGETVLSFIFSMILLKFELLYVIIILLILAIISFNINYKLYKKVGSN